MGCSDRFDYLPECTYTERDAKGTLIRCHRTPTRGVYCDNHNHLRLQKQDAEHTVAELKKFKPKRNPLVEWLEKKK